MTNEEKQRDRELKANTAQELPDMMAAAFANHADIFEKDKRLAEYVEKVVNNPDLHNLYELLAVKRFFLHLDKYTFKYGKYRQFVKLYEALRFTGTAGPSRYKLTPVQAFQTANIYGFYNDEKRICRKSLLFVPRKFSKTTFASAICINDLLAGDLNAQAYVAANTYDQAKICFDEIRNILLQIDPGEKHFKVNRETVAFREGGRKSFIKCLSSSPKKKDGLNASVCVVDEYSQAVSAELKQTLTSSMGTRLNPLEIIITTASDNVDGPFAHELDGVKKVLRGELENDHVFASIFEPDVDDQEAEESTWRKVQPHYGVTIRDDFYKIQYQEAQLSAENMMLFRTKLLNIFTKNESESWLGYETANEVTRVFDLNKFENRPDAMAAIDLSESDDFSAVTIGVYDKENKNFKLHTAYFFPEGALAKHANCALYREWAAKGHLILTKGRVIDYKAISNYILEANKKVRILRIGYDRYKSEEMLNNLRSAGAANVLLAVPQAYGNFTAPVDMFEHGVKSEPPTIFINDNPINAFCFSNAVLDIDNMENKKPIKRAQTQKIDGVITMLMCLRLFMDYKR